MELRLNTRPSRNDQPSQAEATLRAISEKARKDAQELTKFRAQKERKRQRERRQDTAFRERKPERKYGQVMLDAADIDAIASAVVASAVTQNRPLMVT